MWTYPQNEDEANASIAISSEIVEKALVMSLVVIILLNVLFGGGSALLWGMMNSIQIVYFFPLLSMHFPSHLEQFFSYMKMAEFELDLPIIDEYKTRI